MNVLIVFAPLFIIPSFVDYIPLFIDSNTLAFKFFGINAPFVDIISIKSVIKCWQQHPDIQMFPFVDIISVLIDRQ